MSNKLTYIDLFAGCGGLSLGLHNAGWNGIFAIEKSKDAFETLKYNLINNKNHFEWPDWLPQTNLDINEVLESYENHLRELRGKVDLIVGGPPCQGFSTAGRRREDDIRNGLIRSYLKFIIYVQPKIIFFENVKGFTLKFSKNKSKGKTYSQYVLAILNRLGYEVEGKIIDFSSYGIPQKRKRFILVGIRKDIGQENKIKAKIFFEYIEKNRVEFLRSKNLPLNPNLGSAISDLLYKNGTVETPDRKGFLTGRYSVPKNRYQKYLRKEITYIIPDSHSFPKHSQKIKSRFEEILKFSEGNKNISIRIREKYQISKHTIIPLSSKTKAPTITTLPDDYIHYKEPRILTVREYARIQSFPDWFEFKGKYTTGGKFRTQEVPRYTQIGNAIPPLFGELSGNVLKKFIS